MTYTVRFAHLRDAPTLRVGDVVNRGDRIGMMGSSGQSDFPHLDLGVVEGEQSDPYTYADVRNGRPRPAPLIQLLYFADEALFGVPLVVTTPYAEVEYYYTRGKIHYGLDVVPFDRKKTTEHFAIRWNRSPAGRVVRVAYDGGGYGHHIGITYEA